MSLPNTNLARNRQTFPRTKEALEKYDACASQLMICPHTAFDDSIQALVLDLVRAEEAIQEAFALDLNLPKLSRLRSFAAPNQTFRTFIAKFTGDSA